MRVRRSLTGVAASAPATTGALAATAGTAHAVPSDRAPVRAYGPIPHHHVQKR
ncbi:hypothetical protein SAMN05421505_119104 [Sinosporangium album]|uniref:Uncharacterized protein n=1 Tax=Sinosporangium album TaxID=504805 RepID=A0A1G8E466_9ACTN|nr:hypothetical protein [Sinosporangium album]SDH64723.1 hypothetical protein SAMN05421505_119104 [Sinosporangium album]